jgi:hypothetical protein
VRIRAAAARTGDNPQMIGLTRAWIEKRRGWVRVNAAPAIGVKNNTGAAAIPGVMNSRRSGPSPSSTRA